MPKLAILLAMICSSVQASESSWTGAAPLITLPLSPGWHLQSPGDKSGTLRWIASGPGHAIFPGMLSCSVERFAGSALDYEQEVQNLYERDPFVRWVSLASVDSPAGCWTLGMLEPLNNSREGFIQAFLSIQGWVAVITGCDLGSCLSADALKLSGWLRQSRIWDPRSLLDTEESASSVKTGGEIASPRSLKKPASPAISDQEWRMLQLQLVSHSRAVSPTFQESWSPCPINPSPLGCP
jgi:hypothetical protein